MKQFSICDMFDDFISLIFPKICINCRKSLVHQEEMLCTGCRWNLPETNYHLDPENILFQKFVYESKVKFVSAYLFYHRKGIAQKLVHNTKYRNMPHLGVLLGKWYAYKLFDKQFEADCLIPVPIHRKKLLIRGFNQSEEIAKGLSEVLGITVDTQSVIRTTNTSTQTKKSRINRWENVDSVFEVVQPKNIENKNVILIDDVLTTGATLGALVDSVKKANVRSIGILTIAAGR